MDTWKRIHESEYIHSMDIYRPIRLKKEGINITGGHFSSLLKKLQDKRSENNIFTLKKNQQQKQWRRISDLIWPQAPQHNEMLQLV